MMPDLVALSCAGGGNFRVALSGVPDFDCAEIVRHIPGRRLVCRGFWNDQAVYAKLFIGADATRYAERDARGAKALAAHGITTPALLHAGAIAAQTGQALVYAAIADNRNAEQAWAAADMTGREKLATDLVDTVARHHAAGLIQTDLYLRNFLCAGNIIHTLDGDGIRIHSASIPWRQALPNLALLLSKFDVEEDVRIPRLLQVYASRRGWPVTDDMLPDLIAKTTATRIVIARHFAQKKALRDCSDVRVAQDFRRFLAINRARQDDIPGNLLDNPDAWLDDPQCLRLKSGNTCTVGLVEVDGRKIVVKRYNIKNLRHGMGRMLRCTRASASWSNAHLLGMLGIATAIPLALLERRLGPLRREGYFLAEFVSGPDIAQSLAKAGETERQGIATQAVNLLHKLYLLGIEHGDFKATNLKVVDGKPLLLDLDAMRLHRRTAWFERRHARDLRRFLQNWRGNVEIRQLMEQSLRAVYGNAPVLEMAGITRKTNET